jgi:tryptophan synthase beta chain
VNDYYNAHKAEFNLIEPQYHIAQIFVTTQPNAQVHNLQNNKAQNEPDARKKIQMINNRLDSGDDFATLAMNYSEDPETAGSGGDLGFTPESSLKNTDPQTCDVVMKLKPGHSARVKFKLTKAGRKRLATETGAGQWGSALALASQVFGLECKVYMVRVSYDQKPYRRVMMETWGASVVPSPSPDTNAGRTVLEQNADSPGSLGIAISEAVEDAAGRDDTSYSLGSVLNHVLLHQTVIGQEAQRQLALAGEKGVDVVIGCVGGGSNFGGLALPFVRDKIAGAEIDIVACEPAACPTLTRGPYAYDFGDTGRLTPLVPMHTLGHDFVPPAIHAGGLRYHGAAPIISQLVLDGLVRAEAFGQSDVFAAAIEFARSEAIIPAPESAHAIKGAIDAARRADEAGTEQVIIFNLSGHGHFDMGAYDAYLHGRLEDFELPEAEIERALKAIEDLPKPAGVSA